MLDKFVNLVVHNTVFGIAIAQFSLEQISRLMEPVKIGKTGFSFLVERSGLLVATSTLTPVIDANLSRVDTLYNCSHSGISHAMRQIIKVQTRHLLFSIFQERGNLTSFNNSLVSSFTDHGKEYFLSYAPFSPHSDIDWLLVIALPR